MSEPTRKHMSTKDIYEYQKKPSLYKPTLRPSFFSSHIRENLEY